MYCYQIASKCFRHKLLQRSFQKVQKSPISSIPDVSMLIQEGLVAFKLMSGLPWWATFACSTVSIRILLVAAVRKQIIETSKVAYAIPELTFLAKLLRNRFAELPFSDIKSRSKIFGTFWKGVKACFRLHDVSPIKIVSYPLFNIGIFFGLVYSIRRLIINPSSEEQRQSIQNGGLLWYRNLQLRDKTYLLPLTSVGVTYLSIEYSFKIVRNTPAFMVLIKDLLQSSLILGLPFIATLPCGVFFYWIPSSLCAIGITAMLRRPSVMKILRIDNLAKSASYTKN